MGVQGQGIAPGADRFQLKNQLGAGGMGIVYRAIDQRHRREVALKTLKTSGARDLYRFKREFRALCDLAHPNLCQLHELHTTGPDWFFTMELVRGVSFLDHVRPSPDGPRVDHDPSTDPTLSRAPVARTRADVAATPVDLARLDDALYQLCDGVLALHTAGKLHRDLKPSNVLIEPGGRVVLLDFGLISDVAQGGAEHTHEQAAVGTPAYMSPEQAADVPLDAASDWYAVGVMLYEALTGRRPFEGRADEVMRRKQYELPRPPSALAPDTPAHLDALCMRLLSTDPRDRPDGAAVLRALGRAPSEATRTVARTAGTSAPFVGRIAQLTALNRALVDSRRAGVAMMVRGASGMGKSALLARFLGGLERDVLVLAGRCYEREAVPYKALDTLIDALTGALLRMPPARVEEVLPDDTLALGRLFPVLRRVPAVAEPLTRRSLPADPQELRRRGFIALRVLLARLAVRHPLVVVVDDLQWGDLDSVGFLVDLIARADRPQLLLLLAHRAEDEAGPVVAAITQRLTTGADAADLRSLDLPPLAVDEATELIASLTDAPRGGGDWAATLLREAGGNTMFLSELARSAVVAGGAATLDDLLHQRIAALPDAARALLRACAVAARPMAVDVAAGAAGVGDPAAALAILRAERLVRAPAEGEQAIIEPYHDRVRTAMVDDLATGELMATHRELAEAYQRAQPSEREPLIDHLLGAGDAAAAARCAVQAATAAVESLAFRRAADLYAIALDYGAFTAAERGELLISRAHALVNAGQLREAAAAYAEAAPLADPVRRIDLERLQLEQLLRAGMVRDGMRLAEAQMRAIGCRLPDGRGAAIAQVLTQRLALRLRGNRFTARPLAELPIRQVQEVDLLYSLSTGLSFVQPVQARLLQLWHLRRALALGERRRVAMALAVDVSLQTSGDARGEQKAERVLAWARQVAEETGDEHYLGLVEACGGLSDFLGGRWARSHQRLQLGLKRMRDHGVGMRWEIGLAERFFLSNLFYLGELRELSRLLPIYIREAEERGDVHALHGIRSGRPNAAWLVMDRADEARANARAVARPRDGDDGFQLHDYNDLLANTRIDLYQGDGDAALARVQEAWHELEQAMLLRVTSVRIESHALLGTAALASNHADRLAIARRAIAALGKDELPWAAAMRALLIAGVAVAEGDPPRVVRELTSAEDKLRAAGLLLHLQVVRRYRGELVEGAAGAALRGDADAWMREQGVVAPTRLAQLILPRR